jgi:glycerophosphoryl diester phosphodiesterase
MVPGYAPSWERSASAERHRARENFGDTTGGVIRAWNRRRDWDLAGELDRLATGGAVVLSSFNHVLLGHAHQMLPALPVACCWDTASFPADWRSTAELVGASRIDLDQLGLVRGTIDECRRAGFAVFAWGEPGNPRARTAELLDWGVDGVFSDHAADLIG